MWVYKDDHTDVRILGAIAKALPKLMSLESVETFINEKLKNSLKVTTARNAFERFTAIDVKAGEGNPEEVVKVGLPRWEDMRCGVSIKGQAQGGPFADPVTGEVGGFRPVRNELFTKYSTRTQRPVVNFATCTKCTLLVELSGWRVRYHGRGHLRHQLRSLLRLRHLRGDLPGEELHHHGE